MQTVAQSFVVLDITHSGTQLGLTTAASFSPLVLDGHHQGMARARRPMIVGSKHHDSNRQ
jgi:hypothetical protein